MPLTGVTTQVAGLIPVAATVGILKSVTPGQKERVVYRSKKATITEKEEKRKAKARKGRTPKGKKDKRNLGGGVYKGRGGRRHIRL